MFAKYLDISTGHYTLNDSEWLMRYTKSNVELPMRVLPHAYGYWVHIPYLEERELFIELLVELVHKYSFSQAFLTVLTYAWSNQCAWINFDQDADIDNKLSVFDW